MASLSTLKSLQGEGLSSSLASLSTWALVATLGYTSALLIIELLPTPEATAKSARAVAANPGGQRNGGDSLADQIVSAHLFGSAEAPPKPIERAPVDEPAPKSRLNVKLVGTLATGDPQVGHALIGGGREDKAVAVGGKIERATLEEVYASHIIINNGGKRERVELPKPELIGNTGTRLASTAVPPSSGARSAPGNDATVDISQLPQTPGALRDYMVRNPSTMQQLMDVRPYRQNGRVVGYRLNPKQDDSMLRNFGIEPGDVVVSLNGVKLDNQRRGLKALRQLVTAQQIEMTLLRNGSEIPVSISLQ